MSRKRVITVFVLCSLFVFPVCRAAEESRLSAGTFAGLELRNIGPALMSGRIADVLKDPTDPSVWYVAVASGGVWKTVNNGTTWKPVFDEYGSYSTGCLAIDPENTNVVWLGTGENNGQRSVGYGDGVYRSVDAGASWERMGLESSEHIGKIVLDPRDSDVIWVAAQGPLWARGGDRGLYKSTDGGSSWKRVLHVSDNTGVTDVVLDPRDPDVVLAASWQRRRRVWALIAGGPESGIHKSTDGGTTWREIKRGLPDGDVGRIGLALSPMDPDVVYATVAATGDESGFFRSEDRGETWTKKSDYVAVDPQYYQEVFPDPHHFDRVYVMDVWIHVSDDGGASFQPVSSEHRHVDNHVMLFDSEDPQYLLVGGDGGIYESWDRGGSWRYVANLPVTQFYRIGVDNDVPFYNVYGGTQDNSTQGGPSRTTNVHGIRNSDWIITVGGDGYQTRVDPDNPDILYSMYQYGGLIRYDKRNGETVDIQPQTEPGEPPLKWNWDSPLLISPHSGSRLYFAANRLFRSDDRGSSWVAISGDLTRGIDRNQLEVMGRVWSVDAVWKNVFTSFYGNCVALDESPLAEGLLYVGSDDGLVHVTANGGEDWTTVEKFPGVPERTYVADLTASRHDVDTVYAAFNNHKSGDFTPYLLKSQDRGRTWRSIASGLPDRHVVWSLVEDHESPALLFVGTEFGLFFTVDGGETWVPLTGGVPTIPVRDLEIQRRENDLVAGTFGRGILILDDYSPLRQVTEELLTREATLFPVKDAWMYVQDSPLGWGEKAEQGHALFAAPNPPFGAIFTYYLREGLETRREQRRKKEERLLKAGEPLRYPGWDELRAEDRERDPEIVLEVTGEEGQVVRRVQGPTGPGFHRVAWDLRMAATVPTTMRESDDFWSDDPVGPLAIPGTYRVQLLERVEGVTTPLSEPVSFQAVPLGLSSLPTSERSDLVAFQKRVALLQGAVLAASEIVSETLEELEALTLALGDARGDTRLLLERTRLLELSLLNLQVELDGDSSVSRRHEPTSPSIRGRVERVVGAFWTSSADATGTHRRDYDIATDEFAELEVRLRRILEQELPALQEEAEGAGAPWSPGRGLPDWSSDGPLR